jgi:hypothetical protein
MALKEKVKKNIKIYYFSFSSLLTINPALASTKIVPTISTVQLILLLQVINIYILGNVNIDLAGHFCQQESIGYTTEFFKH